ncbi:MAG: hypothetical protein ACLUW6_02255 [Coriobacteriaceae bacterium]
MAVAAEAAGWPVPEGDIVAPNMTNPTPFGDAARRWRAASLLAAPPTRRRMPRRPRRRARPRRPSRTSSTPCLWRPSPPMPSPFRWTPRARPR